MKVIKEVLGRRSDGSEIVKIYFMYGQRPNYLVKAQSYFTKAQKKRAKRKYKRELAKKQLNQI